MSFLVIASQTIPCSVAGSQAEVARETVGRDSRTFDGGLRSTVRVERHVWNVETKPILKSVYDTLRGNVANAAFVTCTGDLIELAGFSSVVARIIVDEVRAVKVRGGQRWIVKLTIRQT